MIIKMLPAKQGDSFLISFENGKNMLIDMGYRDTYKEFIRPELKAIKEKGQCIDLLVITHIDADHIGGAIEFFKENKYASNPNVVDVKEIWYNCFLHLRTDWLPHEKRVDKISFEQESQMKRVIQSRLSDFDIENGTRNISIHQGDTLAGYLYHYGYKELWNSSFQGQAVCKEDGGYIRIGDIEVKVLSPDNDSLKSLAKCWLRDLRMNYICYQWSNEELFDDYYETFARNIVEEKTKTKNISAIYKKLKYFLAHPNAIEKEEQDISNTNGTSIAFEISYDGKRALFLSDAHESIIMKSLGEREEDDFDIVKVSHHGSCHNNFDWIEKVNARRYLFSTNGAKDGHPSLLVIAKIILSSYKQKELYFNYEIESIKSQIDDDELKKRYFYNTHWCEKKIEV